MSGLRRLRRQQESGYQVPGKLFERMTQRHVDILQNIEFCLVEAWRHDGAIDDHVVAAALKAALAGIEPDEPRARSLVRLLAEMRQARADVSDELWTDGLKVVRKSVDTHSAMKPGDRDYLAFVSAFTA